MFAFFKSVAEAIVEKGVRGLVDLVPGGAYACDVAGIAWKKYREKKKDAEQRVEIQQLAQASFDEARKAAIEAVKVAAPDATVEDRLNLELYLSQIPGAIRASLKRPDDASGRTVPPAFVLSTPDDVAKLLPGRPPRFRPNDPVPGLAGWNLVEPLGAGGFGEVWLACHRLTPSLRGAVKFCHGKQGVELKHEHAVIKHVQAAGEHRNIVSLRNVYLEGETPWLMYEYVHGTDLTELILVWQKLPKPQRLSQVIVTLRQLADAVALFHNLPQPIIHRDLKPSNILYDSASSRPKITDFGIGGLAASVAIENEKRRHTTVAGRLISVLRGAHTPLYASPQQIEGNDPDPRDDIHALGVIAYQLMTGQLRSKPGTDFHYELQAQGASPPLIALIGSCVAQNATLRPANGVELLKLIQTLGATPSPKPDATSVVILGIGVGAAARPDVPKSPLANPLQFTVDEARLRHYTDRVKAISLKQEKYSRANYHPETEAELDPLPDEISGFNTIIGVLWGAVLLGVFLIVIGLKNPKLMYIGIADVVVFLVALVIAAARTPYAREMARRRRVLDSASERLDGLERRCKKKWAEYEAMFEALQLSIPKLIAKCGGLSSAYFQQRKDLEERAKATAREQHLRNHVIATSEIAGVGGKRKQLLGDNHIITAFDIARDKIQRISGFGPDLTASLMKWRDEVFNQFRFNPTVDIPETQLRQVAYQYAKEQEACWNDIEDQLRKLVELGAGFSRELDSLAPDLRKSVAHFLAARGNLELLESER